MIGGLGDDSYYVDNAADRVVEARSIEGSDIIYSSISWTLGEHVERLYLTGSEASAATGNALANTLYGYANSAPNVLTGGPGDDVYYLGAGDSAVEDEDGRYRQRLYLRRLHAGRRTSNICTSMSPPPPR
jgi:hypothetical protein